MASTIAQFLVAIGLDVSDFEKNTKRVHDSMEGIRSSSLAIGSSMAAAAIGAGVAIDTTAKKAVALNNSLYRTNTPTTFAQGYQASLMELGDTADTAGERVRGLEENIASVFSGQGGGFLDSLGQVGFDTSGLTKAQNAQEAMGLLIDQFSSASHTQQLNMARTLGLTDAEFKLWQRGSVYVMEHSKTLATSLGYTDDLLSQQREYNEAVIETDQAWTRVVNTLSTKLLPAMTDARNMAADVGNWAADKLKDANPQDVTNATAAATIIGGTSISGVARAVLPGAARFIPSVPFAGPATGAILGDELWRHAITPAQDSLYGSESTGNDTWHFKKASPLGKLWDWWHSPSDTSTPVSPELDTSPEWLKKPEHGTEYAPYSNAPMPTRVDEHRFDPMPTRVDEHRFDPMPTRGDEYTPMSFNLQPDYERQSESLTRALREVPLNVNAAVTVNNRVELDGQQIGEVVDTRIDRHNQESLRQYASNQDR
ncbi:hypothetical protein [Klebsiella pneumoniae]|uniref:hypothetical protein n=1 Tax=Klebsiella pneumoniae TaxID=573 RepID=UPI000B9B7F75